MRESNPMMVIVYIAAADLLTSLIVISLVIAHYWK